MAHWSYDHAADRLRLSYPQAQGQAQPRRLRCSCGRSRHRAAPGRLAGLHAEDRSAARAFVAAGQPAADASAALACRWVGSDGVAVWLEWRGGALQRSAVGLPLRSGGVMLAAAHQRNLQALVDAMQDFVFVLDERGDVRYASPSVHQRLGFGDELLGRSAVSLHPARLREAAEAIVGDVLAGRRTSCPLPLVKADGSEALVDSRLMPFEWDGQHAWLGIARDVSEQRRAEAALREREALFSAIVNQASDGIELVDSQTLAFVEVNEAACRLLGYTREELLILRLSDVQAGAEDAAPASQPSDAADQGPAYTEARRRCKDGRLLDIRLATRTLQLYGRDYRVGVWRDVTRERAHQAELASDAACRIALDQVVELLGLAPLLQRRPDALSSGERQRVAIARALATSPALPLMDQPLAALDARRKAEVLPYLDRLHEELGIPVVYVSHAIDEVARQADHLVPLEAGQVRGSGALKDMLARLDLPLAFGDEAGVVLDAVIGERDAQWQLARLDVDGQACRLWTRDPGQPVGRRVRLRVLARDVSLTRTPQTGTSIGNQLRGTIEAIADDEHPALALVRVRVGSAPIVARLTRRSAHALELAVGMPVWAQVKTVALME